MKFSVIWYSDNRGRVEMRDYCWERLHKVVQSLGGRVIPVIRTHPTRTHANIYRNILEGLQWAAGDRVFLAEHDVLYTPEHFTDAPDAPLAANRNVWHLSRAGFFPSTWPGVFLSAISGDKDALRQAVLAKLAEVENNRWVHAEPECNATYHSKLPIVDIRHGANFTGMRDPADTALDALEPYGSADVILRAMGLKEERA